MGNIRSDHIKRIARKIVSLYRKQLTTDFEENKKIIDEIAEIKSKKLRNRIAGYVTTLIAQEEKGARSPTA